MKTFLLTLLFFATVHVSTAITQNQLLYDNLDQFLNKQVKNGLVDYDAITTNSTTLNSLIAKVASASINTSDLKDYQAFYINAYNLYVIQGIVKYNLKSPLDKNGFFDKMKVTVAGEQLTLNDIENKKLRAVVKDARLHFVLVCGALGCPPLINKAYRPEILEQQLENQTIKAINNDQFIRVHKNKVVVSQIFEWYKVDFIANGSSVLKFISKYRKSPLPEKVKLSFYDYNWKVNKL